MTKFSVFDENKAPAESQAQLKAARDEYGFVPNLLGELAESPAALQAYTSLENIFSQTGLDAVEQQVVLLTVSYENNCQYCVAAHSTIGLKAGIDQAVIDAIRDGQEIATDERLEALRRFTRAVVRNRGLVEQDDIDAFLEAGYTKANMLDVITGVTLKTLSNYTNHIAHTPLDEAFDGMRWSKPILQHAG